MKIIRMIIGFIVITLLLGIVYPEEKNYKACLAEDICNHEYVFEYSKEEEDARIKLIISYGCKHCGTYYDGVINAIVTFIGSDDVTYSRVYTDTGEGLNINESQKGSYSITFYTYEGSGSKPVTIGSLGLENNGFSLSEAEKCNESDDERGGKLSSIIKDLVPQRSYGSGIDRREVMLLTIVSSVLLIVFVSLIIGMEKKRKRFRRKKL